jgi:hypothetical protein
MSCKCAKYDVDGGRYSCEVSGDGCIYLIPDSKKCAEEYGEGPDANIDKRCEKCIQFYVEDGKRCCKTEPLSFVDGVIIESKYIDNDVLSCGGFKRGEAE